jgi:predicted nucleic acid-binding protein
MNEMAVFLDTGFILAIKNSDDVHHLEAQTWMKRFLKSEFGTIYTSTFVFDEVVTLALVRLKRADLAISLGKYILESRRINLVELSFEDFHQSWERFQKFSQNRLSFTDCSILTQVDRLSCGLMATFDRHFEGLVRTIHN